MATERDRTDTAIYPPASKVFSALRLTPLASIRAVILGQDPYHGEKQAHGLAFSVPAGVNPPPSLQNILAELEADLQLHRHSSGSLGPWARHGVLLPNAVMTVRPGKANSHQGMGWEPFTDAIVRLVAAKTGAGRLLALGPDSPAEGGAHQRASRHHPGITSLSTLGYAWPNAVSDIEAVKHRKRPTRRPWTAADRLEPH